jgi:uncharacterized protein
MTELDHIADILKRLKPELYEKFNVSSIGLFGSIVRNEFTTGSDVDIIVDFSKPIGIEFVDLADFLETKVQKHVDLVSRRGVKEKYLKDIAEEIVYV